MLLWAAFLKYILVDRFLLATLETGRKATFYGIPYESTV